MSDLLDEHNDLSSQLSLIQETIHKVLSFPEQVTRPCLIPISKTAYFPGKFIHTNEFVMDLPGEGGDVDLRELKWKSHTETAAELRARAATIKARIAELEGPAGSDSDDLVLMRSVQLPSASDAPSLKPKISEVKAGDLRQATSKSSKTAAVSEAPVSKAPPGTQQNKKSAASQKDVGKGLSPSSSSSPSPSSFFEIREYEDEGGRVTKHELVDISEQMRAYQAGPEAGGASSALGGSSGPGSPSPSPSNSDSVDARALKALNELQAKLGDANFGQAFAPRNGALYPEEDSASALLDSPPVPIVSGDFDFFKDLEEKEEEEEREAAAVARIKAKERELEAKRVPAGGEGWGRGFLNGGPKNVNVNGASKTQAATIPPKASSAPVPAPAPAPAPASGATAVAPAAPSASAPAPAPTRAPVAAPAPRKAAFTNMIVEKNI